MLIHHPTKFGGHKHCSRGYKNILGNTIILLQMWDISNCICPLTFAIIIFSRAHGMSNATCVLKHIKKPFLFTVSNEIIPILITRILGNECENIPKKPLAVLPQKATRRKQKTKTRAATAKLFVLNTNAKKRNWKNCQTNSQYINKHPKDHLLNL